MINKVKAVFPALSHRNYRLFWFGQCFSLIGTWMQNIGQSWLVLHLTGSAAKLGWINAVQFLPLMFCSLFAGVLVDRFPKRQLLLWTQFCLMLLATALATLTYFNLIQYWHLLILAGLLGVVNTLDMPARQTFVIELVGKEDLMNAIALNSTVFNIARIVGPAIAGLLIGLLGISVCFYLNALSFIAVILGLWLIDLPSKTLKDNPAVTFHNVTRNISEGWKYIINCPIIMFSLALLGIVSIFVVNFNIFVPVIATQNLHQNALGFGLLMTAMGSGSLLGALTMAVRSKSGPKLALIPGGAVIMCLCLLILGFIKTYLLVCLVLFLMGFAMIIFLNSVNTILQLNSFDSMRGRVMSFYTLLFAGVTPLGSLLTGHLIELNGAGMGLMVCGLTAFITVGGLSWRYQQRWHKKKSLIGS